MKTPNRLKPTLLLLFLAIPGSVHAQGRQTVRLQNPFAAPHQLQPVRSVLSVTKNLVPNGRDITIESLNRYVGLKDESNGKLIPVQWSDLQPTDKNGTVQATANYVTDLPADTNRVLKLIGPLKNATPAAAPISVAADKKEATIEVRTGRLGVRLAASGSASPPLLAVCRIPDVSPDGRQIPSTRLPWRGRSVFVNTPPIESITVKQSATGPVFFRQTNTYRFALGTVYRCTVTCWAGIDYLTVEETVDGPAGERMRWMFDLGDWPTHVYTAGHGATQKLVNRRHSSAYLDFPLAELDPGKEFLWLPNYLVWSRFEEALLANFVRSAAGPSGKPPFETDMLTIFQIRRGEWEDKMWAARSRRPLGDTPWRPWSQRRWWGSRFGTIRVARNGHQKSGALLKFSLAPGSRSWGLAVGDAATLPPARKMVFKAPPPSLIKTAAGEVRLTELQHFVLDWPTDPKVTHPRMGFTPALLRTMQQKAKSDPVFAAELATLEKDAALRAVLDRDSKAANAIARRILNDINTRFNFPLTDGFEFSSHLTPVGIRPVFLYTTQVDLLLAEKDLLEPAIKQQLRERFVFLAYLLADSSFMAHKYNAGHPNFDADRYTTLAGIAMLYPDHPHSRQWLSSAVGSLREAMRIYVIPKSGKWAENLGGYYNWSTTVLGGLAHALKQTGSADPYAWPEFQDFWRWGLITSLPPKPGTKTIGSKVAGGNVARVRQTPGIGDNGGDGGLGVHGGFALAGANMLQHNPELGRQLLWLWDQGGRLGYRHYPYAVFSGLTRDHLRAARSPQSAPNLPSRVLEGYGSLFRTDFGRPTESYLLFKCGPGGYRYHGEEGSFVLFGQGQPLSLDGGTAYLPEQHGTVTLGQEKTGLLRGRIVQFESTPQFDYTAGRFPAADGQLAAPSDTTKTAHRFQPLVASEGNPADEDTKTAVRALHEEGDVMSRQIFFRKNDYVVIRDRIESVQKAQWRLLLLVEELKKSKQRLTGRGWLGMNVTVSLFQFKPGFNTLEAVPTERIVIDSQPLKQQRMTLPLQPGVGVVAVIDFHKPQEPPWQVDAKDGVLRLHSAKRNITELVELSGGTIPRARWQQLQGTRKITAWSSSKHDDPWQQTRPAFIENGALSVSGSRQPNDERSRMLLCPAGQVGEPSQVRDDLIRYQPAISALQKSGLWATLALGQRQLSVFEPDQTGGLRYREIRDEKTPLAMKGRAEQALRNKLPLQMALIQSGDSPRHHSVSFLARRMLSQWSGFAVHDVTLKDVQSGKLKGFSAAVLLQAHGADVDDSSRKRIEEFVTTGGTLLCDMPSLPQKGGGGASAAWSKLIGFTYGAVKPRGRFALTDKLLGYAELRTADAEFLTRVGDKDLGHWFLKPARGTRIIRDASGRATVVSNSFGRGNVVTLCFRVTSVGPDTRNQVYLAKSLRRVLAESDLKPLVDALWVEKTIIPQDDGGLLIGLHNPRGETVHCPLHFPHHGSPQVTPIYIPFAGSIAADHVILPPRSWVVLGVGKK